MTESLTQLIKCDLFKDLYVILYMQENHSKDQVLQALIHKIEGMDETRQLRILPSIIYIYQNHPSKMLQQFLCKLCQDNFARYLIVKWAFNAYTVGRLLPVDKQQTFETMRNSMDSHAINGKQIDFGSIPDKEMDSVILEWSKQKQHRSQFLLSIGQFYQNLTDICLILKNHRDEMRKSQLAYELKVVWIKQLSKSSIQGMFFPLADQSNFIVDIVFDQCYAFATKERIPYKLVFETVNFEQFVKNDTLVQRNPLDSFSKQFIDDVFNKKEQPRKTGECTTKEICTKLIRGSNNVRCKTEATQVYEEEVETPTHRIQKASLKLQHSYFEQDWYEKVTAIKQKSPYSVLPSHKVRSYLVKAGDDLRQEFFSMQLIKIIYDIFQESSLPLWIRPYDIIMLRKNQGFIEFLQNTMTISALKKFGNRPLIKIYQEVFGDHWEQASLNFTKSLAGYSLLCYLFQIKDRHNGNILIDSDGHIIHIDFSFILSNCPGNIRFQKAPFKLTQEYVQLMGGTDSQMFKYFKQLLILGLTETRKHGLEILKYVQIIREKNDLPCFYYYNKADLEQRLLLKCTDVQIRKAVDNIIYYAANAYTTSNYDRFQYYTNGIRK